MSAPKTSVESRKWRADMRSHAMNWRQWARPRGEDADLCVSFSTPETIADNTKIYLDGAKQYRMALDAEREPKREPKREEAPLEVKPVETGADYF